MRVLGIPVVSPQTVVEASVRDLAAFDRLVRSLPRQIDRAMTLAEELVDIGNRILIIAERLDARAESMSRLGDRLDETASSLLALGGDMRDLGGQIDARGAEIVDRAGQVIVAAADLINVLPTLERALELASPLEGAIDRFGRMVDRFPGAPGGRRRAGSEDAKAGGGSEPG